VRKNSPVTEALHWGRNIKFVSVGWFAFFFYVWLEGKIAAGFLLVAMLTAVYWTVGTSMEQFECRSEAISTSRVKG